MCSSDLRERGEDFLKAHRAALTVLSGPAAGSEYELGATRAVIGRSAKVSIRIEDASVSHEHACIELGVAGFGIRDLGSTNGVRVNGARVAGAALEHGDRVHIGSVELQYVVEEIAGSGAGGRVWDLGDLSDVADLDDALDTARRA